MELKISLRPSIATDQQKNVWNAARGGKAATDNHSTFRRRPGEGCFAVNPKTIVVLTSSFPYALNWSQGNVPAIMHITHAAQEQGTAIADVLVGDYNPAGRLVQTWPKSLDQIPRMSDYDITTGRTYMYFKGEPLYPFGYGLSYSKFEYAT